MIQDFEISKSTFYLREVEYLEERYHGIDISESSVLRNLKKNGVPDLDNHIFRDSVRTKRYTRSFPGYHVQVDVKFMSLKDSNDKLVKRYHH